MSIGITYNERSWAIDLIGHIKAVVSSQNRAIKNECVNFIQENTKLPVFFKE